MDILITGASGFIGSNLIKRLATNTSNNILATTRRENFEIENISVKSECIDILNKEQVLSLFANNHFDCVVHLAAITEHDAIVTDKINTLMTSLEGTKNLIDGFNKYCSGAQFIYTSTGKVYGMTNEMPISEKAVCNPTNVLGKSKYITERLIDYCALPYNKYLISRIFNVYGPNQKSNFVLPTILRQLNKKNVVLGNINDERDYIFLDDLINALICCIENRNDFNNVDVVNIGSGKPISVRDILNELEVLLGEKINVTIDEGRFRKDETEKEYCINRKLKEKTGWKLEYSLHDGLRKTLREEGFI